MHSLAGDISSGLEGVGGDALAVTTVVTLVHLTVVADVLRQTATLSRPVGTLQTGASVEAVALAAACSHTHTHTSVLYRNIQQNTHDKPAFLYKKQSV